MTTKDKDEYIGWTYDNSDFIGQTSGSEDHTTPLEQLNSLECPGFFRNRRSRINTRTDKFSRNNRKNITLDGSDSTEEEDYEESDRPSELSNQKKRYSKSKSDLQKNDSNQTIRNDSTPVQTTTTEFRTALFSYRVGEVLLAPKLTTF